MSVAADWIRGYARQADADFRAWELYEKHPEAVAAHCHKMQFLQMACEKLCKAHLIASGTDAESLQTSHGYIAKPLPNVIKDQILFLKGNPKKMAGVLTHVRHIAQEIEVLSPQQTRDGRRPDNCEYPWQVGETVQSPLDWEFHPSQLAVKPSGITFLKLVRGAINRLLQ
jgi:hypothetical protein